MRDGRDSDGIGLGAVPALGPAPGPAPVAARSDCDDTTSIDSLKQRERLWGIVRIKDIPHSQGTFQNYLLVFVVYV